MIALNTVTGNPTVLRVGWTLLHFLWQGAAVAVLLGLFLLALRSRGPLTRYAAACVTMAVLSVLPPITFYSLTAAHVEHFQTAEFSSASAIGEESSNRKADSLATTDRGDVRDAMRTAPASAVLHSFLQPIVPWCAVLWFIGSIAMTLRLMGGLIQAERLKRYRVTVLDGDWTNRLSQISTRLGVVAPIRLLESAIVHSPMVIGYFKPVILLPISALVGLTPEQLDAILAHELAHVRRRDYWVQLLQRVVEAVLFFHPAVWWVSRQMDIEREHCCDDLAAEACGGTLPYAEALTGLAQLNVRVPAYGLSAAGGSLLHRIRRLLSVPAPSDYRIGWWPGGLAATAVIFALGFGILLNGRVTARAESNNQISQINQQRQSSTSATPTQVTPRPITRSDVPGVALVELSRVGNDPALFDVSGQLAELVSDHLSTSSGIRFVERGKLDQSLDELRLQRSGLVDATTAGKVGSIIGARYFVSGRLMTSEGNWVCTVKCVDTETSQIGGVRVSAVPAEGVATFAEKVSQAITGRIAEMANNSIVTTRGDTALEELRTALAGNELPTIAIAIPESHIGNWVPDPAAENEMTSVLTQAGYRVVDIKTFIEKEQPSWWANLFVGQNRSEGTVRAGIEGGAREPEELFKNKEIAKVRALADVFIVGEAFSESAGEQSGFESCTARVEIKVIDTKSEAILMASSEHAVAADISEHVAGKKALREGGHALGVAIARELASKWVKPAPVSPVQGQGQ